MKSRDPGNEVGTGGAKQKLKLWEEYGYFLDLYISFINGNLQWFTPWKTSTAKNSIKKQTDQQTKLGMVAWTISRERPCVWHVYVIFKSIKESLEK